MNIDFSDTNNWIKRKLTIWNIIVFILEFCIGIWNYFLIYQYNNNINLLFRNFLKANHNFSFNLVIFYPIFLINFEICF
jgi:hypothetical protein